MLQDKQAPAPNSALLRPSPGPGIGHPLGHRPAQVTKIRKSLCCGLRLVTGNTAQHPSPRVWGNFQKEPPNVRKFPSDLPATFQPTPTRPPGLPSLEQRLLFCTASLCRYSLLCPPGWEAPAPGTKVLTCCSAPPGLWVVLLVHGGPSGPGYLNSQSLPPHTLYTVQEGHSPSRWGPLCLGLQAKNPAPSPRRLMLTDAQPHLAARASLGSQAHSLPLVLLL